MKNRLFLLLGLAVVLAFAASGVASANTPAPYFNGFETDIHGWTHWAVYGPQYVPTRVPSGTHGVNSASGNYHAEAAQCDLDVCGGSASTDWGGYSTQFPAGGYTTSLDIYLNTASGAANDTRFDWDSAVSQPDGTFRRDFVFNGGFYNNTDATGSGPRFVFTASNNAGRGGSYPENPARDPFAITTSGWYTFQHRFRDNGSGVLAVDLSILDAGGNVLHTWTLSDPTDVIGTTVGGNRYGWVASNEFPFLAIDNSRLSVQVGPPTSKDDCKNGGWQRFNTPRQFKNQGDCVSYVATGGKH